MTPSPPCPKKKEKKSAAVLPQGKRRKEKRKGFVLLLSTVEKENEASYTRREKKKRRSRFRPPPLEGEGKRKEPLAQGKEGWKKRLPPWPPCRKKKKPSAALVPKGEGKNGRKEAGLAAQCPWGGGGREKVPTRDGVDEKEPRVGGAKETLCREKKKEREKKVLPPRPAEKATLTALSAVAERIPKGKALKVKSSLLPPEGEKAPKSPGVVCGDRRERRRIRFRRISRWDVSQENVPPEGRSSVSESGGRKIFSCGQKTTGHDRKKGRRWCPRERPPVQQSCLAERESSHQQREEGGRSLLWSDTKKTAAPAEPPGRAAPRGCVISGTAQNERAATGKRGRHRLRKRAGEKRRRGDERREKGKPAVNCLSGTAPGGSSGKPAIDGSERAASG